MRSMLSTWQRLLTGRAEDLAGASVDNTSKAIRLLGARRLADARDRASTSS